MIRVSAAQPLTLLVLLLSGLSCHGSRVQRPRDLTEQTALVSPSQRLAAYLLASRSEAALRFPQPARSHRLVGDTSSQTRRETLSLAAAALAAVPFVAHGKVDYTEGGQYTAIKKAEQEMADAKVIQKKIRKDWNNKLDDLQYAENNEDAQKAIQGLRAMVVYLGGLPKGVQQNEIDAVFGPIEKNFNSDTKLKKMELERYINNIYSLQDIPEAPDLTR